MTQSNTFGTLLQGAITHHEMVTSYMQAGFSREEAITITTDMLKHHQQTTMFIANENQRKDQGKA